MREPHKQRTAFPGRSRRASGAIASGWKGIQQARLATFIDAQAFSRPESLRDPGRGNSMRAPASSMQNAGHAIRCHRHRAWWKSGAYTNFKHSFVIAAVLFAQGCIAFRSP